MEDLSQVGKIVNILDIVSGTSKQGKEWSKREFVIEFGDKYKAKIAFTLFGEKMSLLDGYKLGDVVKVHFNIESREFNFKWFHNVNAWKIENVESGNQAYTVNDISKQHGEQYNNATDVAESESSSDLPF